MRIFKVVHSDSELELQKEREIFLVKHFPKNEITNKIIENIEPLRIPTQSDHPLRLKATTHSD